MEKELQTQQEQFNPLQLMPQSFADKYKMAGVLCNSGMLPVGLNTPEKVCVALEWGHELQLPPMVAVNNIAVINGKPTLSADIMHAIAKRNPEYGGLKWLQLSDTVAECVITRTTATYTEETAGYYDIDMARNANLLSKDNWKKYPQRMLKHRALSYALRDAFPDILAGIYSPEEMDGVQSVAAPERNITPPRTTDEECMKKKTLNELAGIMSSVYPDDSPVFSEKDKADYRAMVKNGKLSQALKSAAAECDERIFSFSNAEEALPPVQEDIVPPWKRQQVGASIFELNSILAVEYNGARVFNATKTDAYNAMAKKFGVDYAIDQAIKERDYLIEQITNGMQPGLPGLEEE